MVAGGERGAGLRLGLYVAGKTATYVILGVAASSTCRALVDVGSVQPLRRALAIAVGLALIATGLRFAGLFARARADVPVQLARRLLALVSGLPPTSRAFGIGVLGGFLPCGLSFGALLLATQVDATTAAAGLALFGLATSPALATVGICAARLPAHARGVLARCAGPLLVVLGVLTCARGALATGEAQDTCILCPHSPVSR